MNPSTKQAETTSSVPSWLKTKPDNCSDSLYWNKRYNSAREKLGASNDAFDWYCKLDSVWPLIETYYNEPNFAHAIDQCLVLGCGSSQLPEQLREKGMANVLCIDHSTTVISFQNARYANLSGLQFFAMDVRKMDRFPDGSFDLVIDKACLDAIFCSFCSYNDVLTANSEIYRVLKPQGRFFCLSHGSPGCRLLHFQHPCLRWNVEHSIIPSMTGIHLYVCTKTSDDNRHDRVSTNPSDGGLVEIGTVEDSPEDTEWERRKVETSCLHYKDKWTPGHVRLSRIRDEARFLASMHDSDLPRSKPHQNPRPTSGRPPAL